MVELTEGEIDVAAVLAQVSSTAAGAVLLFLGTVREVTGERRTHHLEYECYPQMALARMEELEQTAREKWPLVGCCIVHRLGKLLPPEASVAVAVSSPHRKAAFEAGQWLIDTLKEVVPIWKKEAWADGGEEWVHPGLPPAPRPSGSQEAK